MTTFKDFGLSDPMIQSLQRMGITEPTPIQEKAIPLAMAGKDLFATAQTGSGKTMAFAIPLAVGLAKDQHSSALILTPTRELAMQIHKAIGQLVSIRSALLIGGDSMGKQFAQLAARPRLIVGTPGRVNDHLDRGSLVLSMTRFLVLDEADRMLDMGFGEQLEDIAEYLPQTRQTLMFSATSLPNIVKLSSRYLQDPERIAVGSTIQAAPQIKQELVQTPLAEKFSSLLKELDQREGSIIVFVRTRRNAKDITRRLVSQRYLADTLHGDLQQRQRERAIDGFRRQKSRIMVATDVAARGLDIPHIKHVINYDLPDCPEDYIHRIGRTARGGAEGNALALIAPEDRRLWAAIERFMDPTKKAPSGPRAPGGRSRGGFSRSRRPSSGSGRGNSFGRRSFSR